MLARMQWMDIAIFIQILTMDDLFKAESGDIRFFREKMNCYPKNPDIVLYEVYIKVPDGTEWNAPLPYDEMMEELGYEFMDRAEWFDYDGDKSIWDKWFKFLHDNGNYEN